MSQNIRIAEKSQIPIFVSHGKHQRNTLQPDRCCHSLCCACFDHNRHTWSSRSNPVGLHRQGQEMEKKKRKTYRQQHQEELRAKKEKRKELFQTILAAIIAIILLGIYLYCKKSNSYDYYDQASEYYLDRPDKM